MNMNISASDVDGAATVMSRASSMTTKEELQGPISQPVVSGLAGLTDAAFVLSTGILAAWVSGEGVVTQGYLAVAVSLLGVFITAAFWCFVKAYHFSALEKPARGIATAIFGLALMISFQIVLTVATAEVYHANVHWLFLWFVFCVPPLILNRVVTQGLIGHWSRNGRLSERVAVVGATSLAKQLFEDIRNFGNGCGPHHNARVVGIFDDLCHSVSPRTGFGKTEVRSLDNLIDLIREDRVDAVLIAIPLFDRARINHVLERLKHTPIDVRICPGYAALYSDRVTISRVGQYTMLNVMERPLCHWKRVAKDIEDRVLGILILTMIAPLMALIAILIKLDSPGPVLFRQIRLGYNNRLIGVLKFRTMHHAMSDPNASQLTTRNDPRVTRLGGFLRRTSLDELPQFINVVRGDMSIVGPRPHALAAKAGNIVYHEAVEYYDARHRMKPGITGWAQVNGWRGETETVEQLVHRVDHDLFYVENWSVLMDLKIIIRTVFCGFTGKSVY